ncbi:hypothetical protein D3C78_1678500 [compost metagenome]
MRHLAIAIQHFPARVVLTDRFLRSGRNIKHPDKRVIQIDIAGVMRCAIADNQRPVEITHKM